MATPTSSSALRTEHVSRKKLQRATVTETDRKGVQPSQNYAVQWQQKFRIISWNMAITQKKKTTKYVQKYIFLAVVEKSATQVKLLFCF